MTVAIQPRRPGGLRRADALRTLATALVAGLITLGLFLATPLNGPFGFVLVGVTIFVVLDYIAVRRTMDQKHATDHIVTTVIYVCALITATPLVLIVGSVLVKGAKGLTGSFFTDTLEGIAGDEGGGAMHAIVGTLSQVGIATLLTVPFGILTAVYLTEIKGRLAGVVRVLVDAMSGIPSIVAGLFIYVVWVIGGPYSGFAASLALSILMLPTVARTAEEMLKLVDPSLREASLALGSPQWRTVAQVVLPTARSGIITAVILGVARIAGETAPLLLTAGTSDGVAGPTKPQIALPSFIYEQFTTNHADRAWAGALVLIVLILVLFVLARFIGRSSKLAR